MLSLATHANFIGCRQFRFPHPARLTAKFSSLDASLGTESSELNSKHIPKFLVPYGAVSAAFFFFFR